MNLQTYFLIFILYSFLGWVAESLYACIKEKKIVDRGFLIGPWLPIYGAGALLILVTLDNYLTDPLVLFVMAIVICSILEYVTSYILEKIFNARWWDYSHLKYNINGRICLETMVVFGFMSLLVMYVLDPILIKLINYIPYLVLNIITIIIFTIFIIDNIVSFKLANDLKKIIFKVRTDNTEEINKIFKRKIQSGKKKLSLWYRRIVDAFPHVKWIGKNHE